MSVAPLTKQTLSVFADYHHFLLQDAAACEAVGYDAVAWTDETLHRMLAVAPTLVAVATARADTVPVELAWADAAPTDDGAGCDLVVESSVDVASGALVCLGPTDYLPEVPRIAVAAGTWGVRIYYRGLATVSPDGFDGDDGYRVVLWPAPAPIAPRIVVDRRG